MSSFRLFSVAICGLDDMKNFSVIHKLQRLVELEYATDGHSEQTKRTHRHRRQYILES